MSNEDDQANNPFMHAKTNIPVAAQLRFIKGREPENADTLSDIEQQQLVICGLRYDGNALPATARLSESGGEWDEEESFRGFITLWDVVDENDQICATAWFYQVDSGTIFTYQTTDVIAEVIQCGIECQDDNLTAQLLAAAREIRERDPEAAKDISLIPSKEN